MREATRAGYEMQPIYGVSGALIGWTIKRDGVTRRFRSALSVHIAIKSGEPLCVEY